MTEPIDRKYIDDDVVYKTLFQQPKYDTISRQAAIDAMEKCIMDCNPDHFVSCSKFIEYMHDAEIGSFGQWQFANGFNMGVTASKVAINVLQSEQPEPKWTPCEKALPKENGFYEVTVGSPYKPVRIYEYKPCNLYENKNRWKAGDGCYVFNWFVEAWRECPKPYERSEE